MKHTASLALLGVLATTSTLQADTIPAPTTVLFSGIARQYNPVTEPDDQTMGIVGPLNSQTAIPAFSVDYLGVSYPSQGPGLVPVGVSFSAQSGGNAFNTEIWPALPQCPPNCSVEPEPTNTTDLLLTDAGLSPAVATSNTLNISFSVPVTSFTAGITEFEGNSNPERLGLGNQVTVDIFGTSGLLSEQDLTLAESTDFFDAVSDSETSPITEVSIISDGNRLGALQYLDFVDPPASVPEPNSLWALLVGLIAMSRTRVVRLSRILTCSWLLTLTWRRRQYRWIVSRLGEQQ